MPTFSELYGDGSNRCNVAISNSYDSCGTITRADIAFATPEGLATIFQDDNGVWRDMEALLSTQLELKSCGIKQSCLYDWLMSSAKGVGKLVSPRSVKGGDGLIEPFILAAQKSIINSDYWAISAGWAGNDGAYSGPLGATPGTAAQRIVRIISRTDLDGDAKWFTARGTVHIFGRSSTGTALRGQWKVVSSAVATDGTYVDIMLDSQNANSSTPYDATPGYTVADFFHAGVVVIGTNNVSDWESWCNNRPALNPNRRIPFWYQTSRYTLCVDQFYKEWLTYLMERNPLFSKFGDVPLAERNKQLGAHFQKEWLWSFFMGKPLPNQSLANYQSLEQIDSFTSSIFDTGTEGKFVGYRANAVGVYEQLRQCGRVKDLQGQKLNLREFFEHELYNIMRSRSSQGKEANSLDIWTDTKTAAQIQRSMIDYYKEESGDTFRLTYDITGSTTIPKLGLRVRSYELVYPQGLTINILTDHFFDDFANAAQVEGDAAGQDTFGDTGRFLAVLDLGGSIYPGIIGSNRKVHRVGELADLARIDQSYGCVMENPTKEITLNSQTWTAIVECPSDSLWVENFSALRPDASGPAGSSYTDSYTDL
jgi:hypothetical protein